MVPFPQMAIYESMLASPHRTLNGDEADFFFVPVLDSCIITRADDAPHLTMKVNTLSFLTACEGFMHPVEDTKSSVMLSTFRITMDCGVP